LHVYTVYMAAPPKQSTIRVSNETKSVLTEMGRKNESYEQVIKRLIGGR
jgi:predicted CopG family antitoxin